MLTEERLHELVRGLDAKTCQRFPVNGCNPSTWIAEYVSEQEIRDYDDKQAAWRVCGEHWAALGRAGIVAIVGGHSNGPPSSYLTDFGRRVLARHEPSPHDESGFIAAIRVAAPSPDHVVLTYVAEAAAAWRAELPRASVVMLGCACERLVLMLAERRRDTVRGSARCSLRLPQRRSPSSSRRCARS
ncbi:MAG TPA: hypothetical protein VGM56_26865 [Byssovorax sp.]|jgi:hypothetical protein